MKNNFSFIWKFTFSKLIILSFIIQVNSDENTASNVAVIPFKTYFPMNYNITDYNKRLISSFVFSKMYLYIEIESGQKVPMFLNFDEVQIHTSETIAFFRNYDEISKAIYSSNCSHICNYNYKTSSSYKQLSDFNEKLVSKTACSASEKMVLYNDLESKQKSINEIKFLHVSNETHNCFLSGIIDTSSYLYQKYSLLYQIKDLIHSSKFTWSFFFTGQNEGQFIIGDIIDNEKLNFYNDNKKENYIRIEQHNYGYGIFWRLHPEKIFIGDYVNETNNYFNIIIHNRYISITKNLFADIKQQYLLDTDEEKKICFEEVTDYGYISIYCNKNKYLSLTNNYNNLHNFVIFLRERENITFSPKDLFMEKGDYVYFFIREDRKNDHFSIGNILLEKYITVFDDEAKLLYILKKKINTEESEKSGEGSGEENKNNKNNTTLKIVLICVLSFILCAIIFVVIGKFWGKKLFGTRKKKANELDDNFDYTSNINDKNNNGGLLDDSEDNGGNIKE